MDGVLKCHICKKNLDNRSAPTECVKCSKITHKGCQILVSENLWETTEVSSFCKECATDRKSEVRGPKMGDSEDEDFSNNQENFKKLFGRLDEMSSQLKGVNDTMKKLNTTINTLKTKVGEVEKAVNFCQEELEEIKPKTVDNSEEIKKLKVKNDELTINLQHVLEENEDMKARNRRHNIEIQGCPMMRDETTDNLVDIVIKIVQQLGIKIDHKNFRDIHRIPSYKKEGPLPIIVSFSSIILQRQIMSKYYNRHEPISSTSIDLPGNKSIFLATHLTPHKKNLFWLARKLKQQGASFVWERNGIIFVKISDSDSAVKINSEKDIKNLETALKNK